MSMQRFPKEKRQEQIAQVALRILGSEGYHKLTSAYLAEEVGLSEGTIFRHFKNKEEIVDAAIEAFEDILFRHFPPQEEDPLRRLRAFVIYRLQILREHPEIRAIAFGDQLAQTHNAPWQERIRMSLHRSLTFVYECLQEAQAKKLVATDVPVSLLVWFVTGVVKGGSMSSPHHIQPGDAPKMSIEQIWIYLELLLRRTS